MTLAEEQVSAGKRVEKTGDEGTTKEVTEGVALRLFV